MRDKEIEQLWRPAQSAYRTLLAMKGRKFDELNTPARHPFVNACADLLLWNNPRGPNHYRKMVQEGLVEQLVRDIDLAVGHVLFHRCAEQGLVFASVLAADLMLWHLEDQRRVRRIDPDDLITALSEPLFNTLLNRRSELGLSIARGATATWPDDERKEIINRFTTMAFCESLRLPGDDEATTINRRLCLAHDLKRALRSIQEIDVELEAEVRADIGEGVYKHAVKWEMESLPRLAESFLLCYIDAFSARGGTLDGLFARLQGELAKKLVQARLDRDEDDTSSDKQDESDDEPSDGPGHSTD